MAHSLTMVLRKKGYTIKSSSSKKIISVFEKSDESDVLFNFLSNHPSCRAFFNAIVKVRATSEFFDSGDIQKELNRMLKASNTSYVYFAKCTCGGILDEHNICDYNFKEPNAEKEIGCNKCHQRVRLNPKSYQPNFDPSDRDTYKILDVLVKNLSLFEAPGIVCHYCDTINDFNPDKEIVIRCQKCRNVRDTYCLYVMNDQLESLVKQGDGYWLEWYAWRQLLGMGAEYGLVAKNKNGDIFDIDVACISNGNIMVFECKDTDNDAEFLKKLYLVNEIADQFYILSTLELKKDTINTARQLMQDKFFVIRPSEIEPFLRLAAQATS